MRSMNPDPRTNGHASPPRGLPVREPLSEQLVEATARWLEAVAKDTRIALLGALSEGGARVQELADRVGVSHQNASHHLTLLWRAGILSRRSEGTATLYEIEDWSTWWMVEQIADWMRSREEEQGTPSPSE